MEKRPKDEKSSTKANGDLILDQRDLFTGKTVHEELEERATGSEDDESLLCPYCKEQPRHHQDSLT